MLVLYGASATFCSLALLAAFVGCFPIGALTLGNLEVLWTDGRQEIDRDDEIAVETICACLEKAVRRFL